MPPVAEHLHTTNFEEIRQAKGSQEYRQAIV
jgi:hypothetical protein